MTLRKASIEVGCDPKYLKGYAVALGVDIKRIGPRMLVLDRSDLERLKERLANTGPDATQSN